MRDRNCSSLHARVCSSPHLGRLDKAAGFGECLCSRKRVHHDEAKAHKTEKSFGMNVQETMLESQQIHTQGPVGSESNP